MMTTRHEARAPAVCGRVPVLFGSAPRSGVKWSSMADHESSRETRTTLISGVCQHDPASWSEFVLLYDSLLKAYIRSCDQRSHLGVHEADREDVKQDVLIKLVHWLPTFDMKLRFRTWLWTVTHNVVIDWVRQQRGRRKPPASGAGRPRPVDWTPEMEESLDGDATQTPEQQLIQAHDLQLLRHVLEKVKAEMSGSRKWDCFQMRYYDDMPSSAVAAKLGISVQAVDVNTWRVRARIREWCEFYEIDL
jgi:RNA polymerase sigma factor (sigma-70 family)